MGFKIAALVVFLVAQNAALAYASPPQQSIRASRRAVGTGRRSSTSTVVLASSTAGAAVPELKSPLQLYQGVVDMGAAKASLSMTSPVKTLVLSVLSGAHIAFGAFLVLSVGGACPGLAQGNPGLQKIVSGLFGLPFGLMMVLIGGGELFTGNTALLSAALYEKKIHTGALLRNWSISYAGNFAGSLLMAGLVFASGTLGPGPQVTPTPSLTPT